MKVTCNTAELKTALAFASRVISKQSVIIVLESYLIEPKNGIISITTSDLETYVTKDVQSARITGKPVSFLLDQAAANFIKVLTAQEVTLSVETHPTSKGGEICSTTITCGNKTGKFMGEDAQNFPKIPVVESDQVHQLDDKFQAAITRAIRYVSNDDLRPAMTGVNFGEKEIAATDAHRLYVYKHGLNFKGGFICPAKAAGLMTKLKDCKLKYFVTEEKSQAIFYNQSTSVVTRPIDARFPDFNVVIPKDNNIIWKAGKKAFKEAITTVMIAANHSTKQAILEVKATETTVRANDCDFNMEATDIIPSTCTQDYKIAFNSEFLLGLLADTDGEDIELAFGLSSDRRQGTMAALMKQNSETFLIMPLMINEEEPEKEEPEEESDLKDLEEELQEAINDVCDL